MADNNLKITIQADTADAQKGIEQVNVSLDKLDDVAKGAAGGMGDLGAGADKARGALGRFVDEMAPIGKLALGINEIAELFGRISGMAGDLMAVADSYKQMAARLEIATGGGQALEKSLAAVRDIANTTGADLEATAGLYARLAQSSRELGLTQEQVARLTETVSKAMVVSGASAGEASGALRQLSQALASGVLRGDEFNSLMEQAPRLMEALAQSLGVTTGELRKMAEQGKLTADKVVGALQSQAAAIDEQFAKMPMTVGRAVQQLQNEWTVFLGELDRTTGASELTAKAISGLAGNLDLVADAARTAGLAVAAGLVAQAIPALKALAVEMLAATTKAGGLATAIKSIPTSVKVAVAVVGLDLAIEGARLLGETLAKMSPEVQASEAAMRRYREELARQAGDARAAAQALDQYANVNIRSAEAVARMGEAERARYAEGLAKAQQYWQAMAREAALMEEIGQKGTASADEAARQLSAIRQGMEAVAAAGRMSREAVANLIDPRAQALVEEFGKALKEMADKGTTGTEAVKKSLDELRKSLDLSSVESIRAFGQALDELRERGTVSAKAVSDEWTQAIGKLSGEALQTFAVQAQAAFGEGERNARALADVMDLVLRRAVVDAGADWEILSRGISKGAADALANVDLLIAGADRLKLAGVDAGAAIEAGLVAALQKVKTTQDLEAVAARMRDIGLEGEKAGINVARAFEEAKRRVDEMTPGINSVEEAFKKLGLTSSVALKTAADEAQRAYQIIAASAEPIELKIKAWERYAQAAIASGDAVRMEMARQQAAVLGVTDRFDQLARQAGVTGDALKQTAVSTSRLADAQGVLAENARAATGELMRQKEVVDELTRAEAERQRQMQKGIDRLYEMDGKSFRTAMSMEIKGWDLLSAELQKQVTEMAHKAIGKTTGWYLSPKEYKEVVRRMEEMARPFIEEREREFARKLDETRRRAVEETYGTRPAAAPETRPVATTHSVKITLPSGRQGTVSMGSAQDAQTLVDLLRQLGQVRTAST